MAGAHPREYPRVRVRVGVGYTVGNRSGRAITSTLGGGGLFLTKVEDLEPGSELSIWIRPARHQPVIQAKAVVRYIVAGQGAAIEFTDISPQDRQRLLRFIHQKTGDRRLMPRAPLATQVQCDKCMSLAFSRDVSLGGMFIETAIPLPIGSTITVRFNLDQKEKVVTAIAEVAYHVERMGMGVLFTQMSRPDRDAIREYVETLQAPSGDESARNQSGSDK